MPSTEQTEALARPIQLIQIIAGAIALGPAIFFVIVLFLPGGGPVTLIAGIPTLTFVAITFALSVLRARAWLVKHICAQGRRQIAQGQASVMNEEISADLLAKTGDVGKLLQVFQKRTILSVALIEGPVFFMIVAYMLERSPIAFGAVVVLILILIFQIPSRRGVERWIEEQHHLIEQERRAAPPQ